MTSWEIILDLFPQEKRLELTSLEEDYLPVYATQAFAAYYKETRCIFAYFVQSAIWCEGIGNIWRFTSDNTELIPRSFDILFTILTKLRISTLYYKLPSSTESKSSGISQVTSGNTSIIEWYISKVLALRKPKKPSPLFLENSRKKDLTAKDQTTKNQTKSLIKPTPQKMTIQPKSTNYYDKLKPQLLQLSRNSPVVLIPLVPKEPPVDKQVCFLEAPNFQYQKKVRFLHHLCLKPRDNKYPHPRLSPNLQDPYKPPQYPPQPSQQHHQYREETPKELYCQSLLTKEKGKCHRNHPILHLDHQVQPLLCLEEPLPPNYWEVPLNPMMGTQQKPKPFGTCWPTIIQWITLSIAPMKRKYQPPWLTSKPVLEEVIGPAIALLQLWLPIQQTMEHGTNSRQPSRNNSFPLKFNKRPLKAYMTCIWATGNLMIGTKIGATMPDVQEWTITPRCMHSGNASIPCSSRN